jgi:hypothetical protein
MIFPSESSWGSIYSIFGVIIFLIGMSKLTRGIKYSVRLPLLLIIFLGTLGILFFTDYINVKRNNVAPMFRKTSMYLGGDEELLYYDTPFYDVIKCNEKFNIVKNKNYTDEEYLYTVQIINKIIGRLRYMERMKIRFCVVK